MGQASLRHRNEALGAYCFLAPWFAGLLLVTAGPMLASLYLSFTDYNALSAPQWVGLQNYVDMLHDRRFWKSAQVTLLYVGVSVPAIIIIALGIAVMLDRGLRWLRFYRTIFYVPSLLGSSVAIAILWRVMFGENGFILEFLNAFGIHQRSLIGSPSTAVWMMVLLNVWGFGSTMTIFLAGLKQIPESLLEAARIDGANPWQRFWHVRLPMLTPVLFFNVVLQTINSFQSFTAAHVMSGGSGGPRDSTLLFPLYLYQRGFVDFDMGYAAGMAWVLLAVIAVSTALMFTSARYWVFYGD